MSDYQFAAMGCEIIVGGGAPSEHRAVERLFRERELVFSRFLSGSELNRVNDSQGRLIPVSQLFADTLAVALRVARQTEGLIEPTLGAALQAAGYARDFALLEDDPEPPGASKRGAWQTVLLIGRRVGIPHGVQLDLNGVVKGLAVDDALGLLTGDAFVSAGGDLAARGELNVALPDGETVLLRRGALATSGSTKRQWLRAERLQHHLIDPDSGRPAQSPWQQVTACGSSCLSADVAAKAGFLLGERGPAWLDRRGIPTRFLTPAGDVVLNRAWHRSISRTLVCT